MGNCQLCGREVQKYTPLLGNSYYLNYCRGCRKPICVSCAEKKKIVNVAGNIWLCECGRQNIIRYKV